jgi:hypothetical protein
MHTNGFRRKRFRHIDPTRGQGVVVNDRLLSLPGHVDHLYRWAHGLQASRQGGAAHARHHRTGQQQVDRPYMPGAEAHGFVLGGLWRSHGRQFASERLEESQQVMLLLGC